MYEVIFKPGTFNSQKGAEKLTQLLNAYSQDGKREVVAVVPIIREGETKGIQIVVGPLRSEARPHER
jgi:hypothetical protein